MKKNLNGPFSTCKMYNLIFFLYFADAICLGCVFHRIHYQHTITVSVSDSHAHHLGPSGELSATLQQHFSDQTDLADHQCEVWTGVQAKQRAVPV